MPKVTTTLYGELAVCPYKPEAPIREFLEWLTDVDVAADGTEDRYQKRNYPRQIFEYSIPLPIVGAPDFLNQIHGAIRLDWAVPVWNESQFVGNVSNGQTIITCETTGYAIREDSLAMLWKSTTNWQIVEIQSYSATNVVLYSGATGVTDAYLIPVRVCIIDDKLAHRTDAYRGMERVRFRVKDNREIYALLPDQYDSADIYYDDNEIDTITKTYDRDQKMADFDLGAFTQFSEFSVTKVNHRYSQFLNSFDELYAFKRFAARRAGKFQPFYYPSFENDLQILSTGALTTTVNVVDNSIVDYASDRYHIVFRTADAWYPREIDFITVISSSEIELTLTTSLGINADDILFTSYLGFYRFDTDRVEMRHETAGVTRVNVPIVEIQPYRVPPPVIE